MSLTVLSTLYRKKIHRLLGAEWSAGALCEFLDKAGVVTLRTARNGKRWIFLKDVWDSFSTHQKSRWNTRVERMRDPYAQRAKENRKEAVRDLVAEALESLTKKSTVTESSTDGGTSGNP